MLCLVARTVLKWKRLWWTINWITNQVKIIFIISHYLTNGLDPVGIISSSSSSSLSSVKWPELSFLQLYVLFAPLSSSPQTSLEPPSMQLLSTTFHFPFDHFPLPVPHISSLLPLFLPPLLPLLPGALCRRCHNRRWNRFICSNVVWAAAWHGAEQHFLPVHTASLPLCLQFMCFQTGQSTPLSCAGLSLPLPPTISALSVSVKSHQSSLTQTIISSGKLQWPDSPLFTFTAFLCSHLSRFFLLLFFFLF